MLQNALASRNRSSSARKNLGRCVERLALRDAEQLDGLAVPTDSLPRSVLQSLDHGTALLEYYLSEAYSGVFVAYGGTLVFEPLNTSPTAIRRLMGQWRLNLQATAGAIQTGRRL